MRKALAQRIKQERIKRNKTQEEIATMLNIQRATYGYYENGKVLPPVDNLVKLANYFDVTIDYLVGMEEETPLDVVQTLKNLLIEVKQNKLTTTNKLVAVSLEETLKIIEILGRI